MAINVELPVASFSFSEGDMSVTRIRSPNIITMLALTAIVNPWRAFFFEEDTK